MTFFSLTFLLLFLPGCLALYYCAPNRLKNPVLLLLSLFFYYTLETRLILLLLASVVFDYAMASLVHYGEKLATRRAALCLSAGKTVLLLLWTMARFQVEGVPPPAGILVYTLSATGYVVDLYREEIQFEHSILDFLLYNCFFGRILLGPYVKYAVIRPQLRHKRPSLAAISTGMVLLIQGIAKKVVLADGLMETYRRLAGIAENDPYEVTLLSSWLLVLFLAFGVTYTLSAYCDVARGLGQIFCFKLPRNLYYPLHVRSVREFVSRFNSTYFEYLRRYVYRPLGGGRYGALSDSCNTLVYMALYGLWFALSPNCALFGALLGLLMLGEKYVYGRLLSRLPWVFGKVYTVLGLLGATCLLAAPSPSAALELFRQLFRFRGMEPFNDKVLYIFTQSYWLLGLGLLFSFAAAPRVSRFFVRRAPAVANLVSVLVNVALLLLSIMFIM